MKKNSTRAGFINRIGLQHDPFATPVAEQELELVQDIFYSYYSPPTSIPPQEELSLRNLRQPQHAFIFGDPGSGKSTLRLTLEADCRTVLDNTLTITYTLGEDIEKPLSLEEHGTRLARALAIDLSLYIIEQFNPLNAFPNEEQIQGLQQQVQVGGRHLKRLIKKVLEKLEDQEKTVLDPKWGISREWKIIGKAPVKYVGGSEELRKLLEKAMSGDRHKEADNWDVFWAGIRIAHKWGFSRFLVLIDGVDTKQRTTEAMLALIKPLIDSLPQAQSENVFFKFFLPFELNNVVPDYLRQCNKDLHSNAFFYIIEWDKEALRQLVMQRFRAASSRSGPRYMGLNGLAEPGLDLDEKVIKAAKGSPRRLLSVISTLIDVHIGRDPDSLKIGEEDWDIYQQQPIV